MAELETASPPEVIGFAAFQQVADEGELQNIALDPAHQRRGYGRLLLQEGIGTLRASGARRIFLEVRASNHAACKLYASAGFSLLSTRKDYYQNPAEDALVLALDLMASTEAPLPMK